MFFFVALRWAPRPFGGARAKKCFFLLRPRGKAGEGEAPCRHGARAKKETPPRVFFFAPAPGKGRGRRSPFPARGRNKKKNTTGWCFLFCCGPARTLTHSLRGLGGDASPRRGGVFFFFFVRPRPDRGGVFFLLLWPRPDAHSLTVGWGDFGKARVVFFLLLRPRRVFLDNNKKCLGYYIGSKKTRRGHSKKKTPLPACPGLGVGGIQWGVGRPARGRFFLLRVRGAFFLLLRVRGKFTHSLAARRIRASPAERHPGSRARFFAAGALTHSLTHSLPAARSTHSKKAPTTKTTLVPTLNPTNTITKPKP